MTFDQLCCLKQHLHWIINNILLILRPQTTLHQHSAWAVWSHCHPTHSDSRKSSVTMELTSSLSSLHLRFSSQIKSFKTSLSFHYRTVERNKKQDFFKMKPYLEQIQPDSGKMPTCCQSNPPGPDHRQPTNTKKTHTQKAPYIMSVWFWTAALEIDKSCLFDYIWDSGRNATLSQSMFL